MQYRMTLADVAKHTFSPLEIEGQQHLAAKRYKQAASSFDKALLENPCADTLLRIDRVCGAEGWYGVLLRERWGGLDTALLNEDPKALDASLNEIRWRHPLFALRCKRTATKSVGPSLPSYSDATEGQSRINSVEVRAQIAEDARVLKNSTCDISEKKQQ